MRSPATRAAGVAPVTADAMAPPAPAAGKLSLAAASALDHETRATDQHHQSVRLWLRLLTCTSLLQTRIRGRLRHGFASTLPRYDLMAQLERHPEGLRMVELSRRMMVSGGSITGITDQLEAEGLVVREEVPRDRRAFVIKLTHRGREMFGSMARAHERWVMTFFDGVPERDRQRLHELLARLKQGVALRAEA